MGGGQLGEFGSIARFLAPLAGAGEPALGLLDDAAVYTPPAGQSLVFTKDAMVAGVHFLPDDPPEMVVRKLVRVNLSDLAAMGAVPVGYLVAAVLPEGAGETWMAALGAGLAADQALFGWRLWGGDTVTTPGPATLSLTAIGLVAPGQALLRSGARVGDRIFVSGTIGDGALGLAVRKGELADLEAVHQAALEQRFLLPTPRLALGQALIGLATAAMDISDGLAADLGHLCAASGVGARLNVSRLPLSAAARAALALKPELSPRLFAGDDYELLFTVPAARRDEVLALGGRLGLELSDIGEIVAGEGVAVMTGAGTPVAYSTAGYRHF